jgi:predicted dithiol-disulfide oxidoreductase (DUF899 family)
VTTGGHHVRARHLIPGTGLPGLLDDRGAEHIGSTWSHLDMTALGRQEAWEDSPARYPQTSIGWWNYHDAYREDG